MYSQEGRDNNDIWYFNNIFCDMVSWYYPKRVRNN